MHQPVSSQQALSSTSRSSSLSKRRESQQPASQRAPPKSQSQQFLSRGEGRGNLSEGISGWLDTHDRQIWVKQKGGGPLAFLPRTCLPFTPLLSPPFLSFTHGINLLAVPFAVSLAHFAKSLLLFFRLIREEKTLKENRKAMQPKART